MADFYPEDLDGSDTIPGRSGHGDAVEHTLQGWLEGYLLTWPPRLLPHL